MAKRVLLICAAVTLGGCQTLANNPIYGESGVIKDRSTEYAQAQPGKRLEIPAGMNAKQTRDGLLVPQLNSSTMAQAQIVVEVPRPEFFFAAEGGERASIRPLEGERVILVDEPIDQVWNEVMLFWRDVGIAMETKDPRSGVMESEWIRVEGEDLSPMQRVLNTLKFNSEANEPSLNKLRLQLRPDPEVEGRTAISMKQVQIPLSADDRQVDWMSDADELAYSNELMFTLLDYLSRSESQAPTLSDFQRPDRLESSVGRDSRNRPLLSVKAPADEAWDLVNAALDRAGVDVGTRNEESGRIYLTFVSRAPEAKPQGLFDWLKNRESGPLNIDWNPAAAVEASDENINYTSDPNAPIVGAVPTQEELQAMDGFKIWVGKRVVHVFGQNQQQTTEDGERVVVNRYQLAFNRARSGVLISVHDRKGNIVSKDTAAELLWTIKDNIGI
ncbi:MAG TPA: outer membrane protein assembly factor BamC [Marinobacterium sp.]|nr:outer membrane protein assembly factor BamC [Marinobacterium sp.]